MKFYAPIARKNYKTERGMRDDLKLDPYRTFTESRCLCHLRMSYAGSGTAH
jgi:hypothetical protein